MNYEFMNDSTKIVCGALPIMEFGFPDDNCEIEIRQLIC